MEPKRELVHGGDRAIVSLIDSKNLVIFSLKWRSAVLTGHRSTAVCCYYLPAKSAIDSFTLQFVRTGYPGPPE
jgi:hypothetical protein